MSIDDPGENWQVIREPLLTCAKAVSNIAIALYKIKYWPQIILSVVCLAYS